jgi:hypothetical protein
LWVLRGFGVPDAEGKAREVGEICDRYPGWPYNQKIEGALRTKLYVALKDDVRTSVLRETRDPSPLKEAVDNILKMHRAVMGS